MKKLLFFLIASCMVMSLAKAQNFKIAQTEFRKDTFNVISYGAQSGPMFENAKAIQSAIDACHDAGGGVVKIPHGYFLSGPIVLKDNVNLYLENGSILSFAVDHRLFPLVKANWEGHLAIRCQSPISASQAHNIAITGAGVIDGGGDGWRPMKREKETDAQWKKLTSKGVVSDNTWYPTEGAAKGASDSKLVALDENRSLESYEPYRDFFRPNLIVLDNCNTILLEGVTFKNSPAWCIHPLICHDLTVSGITVSNPWNAQNGDGIDIESCRNFLLQSSVFDAGDDGICIKSGRDAEGRKRGIPTENGIIRNDIVYHAHGGFVIGSEMSGGVRNLYVSNCAFIGTDVGLRFKSTRGRGGVVENIYVDGVSMKDIAGDAILFDMYYMAKDPVPIDGEKEVAPKEVEVPVSEETPIFRNFYIKDVTCDGASRAIFIRGLPEMPIEGIHLSQIAIRADEGVSVTDAHNMDIKDLNLSSKKSRPLVAIKNSRSLRFKNVHAFGATNLFLKVEGQKCSDLKFEQIDEKGIGHLMETSADVSKDAVHWDK